MRNIIEELNHIHDEIDGINYAYGTSSQLCIFCLSNKHDSSSGIIHRSRCPILAIRALIKEAEEARWDYDDLD